MNLDDLALFLLIVEKDGLSAAGREVDLSPASVSERLHKLERALGCALLTRTTRAISLTEEGRTLADGARRLLAEAKELEAAIVHGAETLSGPIRFTLPEDLGRSHILPIVDDFLVAHPKVTIDVELTDGYVNLVERGLDFAVRYGTLKDSSLRARLIGRNRRIVCGSPAYFAKFGTPRHPDELIHHQCLMMRFNENPDHLWPFVIDQELRDVPIQGVRIANDGGLVRHWAKAGHGIALKSIWDVGADLAAGSLVEVLSDYATSGTSIQIVHPAQWFQTRRVRALIDVVFNAMSSYAVAHGLE